MTEQQACTLCGAGGRTAAQCNWNKAIELIKLSMSSINNLLASIRRDGAVDAAVDDADLASSLCHAFLASQQGEQPECGCCGQTGPCDTDCDALQHPEQAEGAQGEREAEVAILGVTKCSRERCAAPCAYLYPVECMRHHMETLDKRLGLRKAQVSAEQEAFELHYNLLPMEKDWLSGAYRDTGVRTLWDAWQARAALAQPSPAPELGCERCGGDCSGANPPVIGCPNQDEIRQALDEIDDFIARCNGDDRGSCGAVNLLRHALASRLSPAPELERPEVVAHQHRRIDPEEGPGIWQELGESSVAFVKTCGNREVRELMTVAQYDRIVGALREKAATAKARQEHAEMLGDSFSRVCDTLHAERDAAQARVAELEAHCVRLGQGDAERYWENRWREADARLKELEKQPKLTVWFGSMPESNGKSNFTAVLMHKGASLLEGITGGITIERSEYPDRVRYEADRMRYLIGEREQEPDLLDYDAEKHSGYKAPVAKAGQVPEEWRDMLAILQWHYRDHDDHWHRPQGYYCPQCGGEQDKGHEKHCELAALLAAAPAQGGE